MSFTVLWRKMEVSGEARVKGQGVKERRGQGRGRTVVSGEIRAALGDHVLNHALSMSEAGQKVQPDLIICTFRK